MNYSDRIKRARSALGLTQQAAALKWGVSQQCISQWESGRVQPKGLYKRLIDLVLHEAEHKSK